MTNGIDSGIFTISLDFELIWGTLDKYGSGRFSQLCATERSCVIDRLLDLFVEYGISATWCTVGHLFLDKCPETTSHAPLTTHRPCCFLHGPGATEETAPLFHARSLIEKILGCSVRQEIGCHTFSHAILGDAACSRATAQSELESCAQASQALGIEMRSFAFPRNRVGHLDVLRSCGFACFRGPECQWWNSLWWPKPIRRAGHLCDVLTARTPPVVLPEMDASGLWNIPGSMLFTPTYGLRRSIPVSFRVRRARKGLDAAVQQRRIFHLWFHPTDLAGNVEPMLGGLREVLEYSRGLRDRNQLQILPMGSLVPKHTQAAVA